MTIKPSAINYSNIIIFLVYLAISSFILLNHELWRDELHSWNIVNYSHSLSNLYQNIRLEGHPILWYTVLFFFKKLGFSYLVLPYINFFFAAFALFLFLQYSPFTVFQKILFPFGIIFGYEYTIISRNYALSIPLFFIFCLLFTNSKNRLNRIFMVFLLFLAMNTSIFASLISIGIFCAFWGKLVELKVQNFEKISYLIIILVGIILSFLPIYIHYISIYSLQQVQEPRKILVLFKYLNQFKNSYLFLTVSFVSAVVFVITVYYRKTLPKMFLYFIAGLIFGAMLVATFWAQVGASQLRHFGFLFVLFIVIFWLFKNEKMSISGDISSKVSLFFTGILLIQIPFYFQIAYQEITLPFTNNTAVFNFIKKNNLEKSVIIGNRKYLLESFGTLFQKKFYTFDDTTAIDFVRWNTNNGLKFFDQKTLNSICNNQHENALLIMGDYPIGTDTILNNNNNIKYLGSFDGAFRSTENYKLYYFKR